MKWKQIFLATSCLVLGLINVTTAQNRILPRHPVRVIYDYETTMPEEMFFTPYETCLFALADMDKGKHYEAVEHLLRWYFSRVNKLDKYGLSGTVYDFKLKGNKESVVRSYDSVDGYSGIFLYLLNEYHKATGDSQVILANWDKINDIAYTIPYLQQKDGLTIAYSEYPVEYLMDNCEAYGGITAYLELARSLHQKIDYRYYTKVADSIKNGIYGYLPAGGTLSWSKSDEGLTRSDWKTFYPDAYAQIFPVFYNLGTMKDRVYIWEIFIEHYPEIVWHTFPIEQRIFCELTKAKLLREGYKNE